MRHLKDKDVIFDVYDVEQAFLSMMQKRELYCGHPKGYVFIALSNSRVGWRELKPFEKVGTCLPGLVWKHGVRLAIL